MSKQLLIGVSCLLISGASLGQAPVVDATTTNNTPETTKVQASALNLANDDLEGRLVILERIVDSRTQSQQRMQGQLNDLQTDIDEMRGSIELHNHQLEKLLERQRELFLELDRRFENMQQDSNNLASDIASIDAGTTSTPSSSTNSANEQVSYQAAVNLILKDKDYDKAVPAFQSFLAQYPNSDLTANAHYWLGQLLFNKQNYAEAKEQFEQVVSKFTDSPKRADSMLKLGMIEKSIGNQSAANSFFNKVVQEYPDSTPARLASQQLAN